MMKVEYRVRPVTRYVLTRFHKDESSLGGVENLGEYPNKQMAERVKVVMELHEWRENHGCGNSNVQGSNK